MYSDDIENYPDWRVIPNTDNKFWVSKYGEVWATGWWINDSIGRSYWKKAKPVKLTKGGNGYYQFTFQSKRVSVHVCVAKVWVEGYDEESGHVIVNHKDGDKLNNDWRNLEWNTYSFNNQHALDTGLRDPLKGRPHSLDHHNTSVTEDDVKFIRENHKLPKEVRITQRELGKRYGISQAAVSLIALGGNWKYV